MIGALHFNGALIEVKKVYTALFFGILLAPLAIYFLHFNQGISSDHTRWAEFSTYISGIYSPVIALLAFLILVGQVKSQNSMDKHNYDRDFISSNVSDFTYYMDRIESYIEKRKMIDPDFDKSLGLLSVGRSIDEMKSEEFTKIAESFVDQHQKLHDLWVGILPIIKALGSQDEMPYMLAFQSVKIRAISVLSFRVCMSLEAVCYCLNSESERDDIVFNG